jgi:hypothetical protein
MICPKCDDGIGPVSERGYDGTLWMSCDRCGDVELEICDSSCADLRAELASVVAERDELRANLARLRGVVEMFEARGRSRT